MNNKKAKQENENNHPETAGHQLAVLNSDMLSLDSRKSVQTWHSNTEPKLNNELVEIVDFK